MNHLNRKSIGLRIKRLRTRAKIKQRELATNTGVNPTHVSLIEKGSPVLPHELFDQISKTLLCALEKESDPVGDLLKKASTETKDDKNETPLKNNGRKSIQILEELFEALEKEDGERSKNVTALREFILAQKLGRKLQLRIEAF